MPEIPAEAIDAAAGVLWHGLPGVGADQARHLARVALEAAAPLLAEAWGVSGTAKPRPAGATHDPRARVTCRRCGAQPGRSCITSRGTRAPMVHAERRNDSRRAEGQTTGLEHEGMHLDRFPPPPEVPGA